MAHSFVEQKAMFVAYLTSFVALRSEAGLNEGALTRHLDLPELKQLMRFSDGKDHAVLPLYYKKMFGRSLSKMEASLAEPVDIPGPQLVLPNGCPSWAEWYMQQTFQHLLWQLECVRGKLKKLEAAVVDIMSNALEAKFDGKAWLPTNS
jgi:hypothetical protein